MFSEAYHAWWHGHLPLPVRGVLQKNLHEDWYVAATRAMGKVMQRAWWLSFALWKINNDPLNTIYSNKCYWFAF